MPDTRGLALGSPCQNEHTINRGPDVGDRRVAFWITCGDDTIATAHFEESSLRYQEEPRNWSEKVMLRHEVACWKALAREARDELDQWGYGGDPDVEAMIDRINAALREGKFADA